MLDMLKKDKLKKDNEDAFLEKKMIDKNNQYNLYNLVTLLYFDKNLTVEDKNILINYMLKILKKEKIKNTL